MKPVSEARTGLLRTLSVVWRAVRLLAHLAWGLLLVLRLKLPDQQRQVRSARYAQGWLARLLRILDVRVEVRGAPARSGVLFVANHVSWLDIPVLGAAACTRFVAKSEIAHWPIAGAYANAIGTFYIRRGAGGSRPLIGQLGPHLAAGGSVVLFPEGTTTDGRQVLPFHPRLFQAAIDARRPVQPVSLRYRPVAASGPDPAPFVGEDTLVDHVLRLLDSPGLMAEVSFGLTLPVEHYADRHSLAADAEQAVRRGLGLTGDAAVSRPSVTTAGAT